jgi:predicted glycosyltransferase
LEKRGYSVLFTARDAFQVCGLADEFGLRYTRIGRHYGANKIKKVMGTIWRFCQLVPIIMKQRPDFSISHGSRSLLITSAMLRIPTLLLFDYEHTEVLPFIKPEWGMAPAMVDGSALGKSFRNGFRSYDGLKEDVYVSTFKPNPSILGDLGIQEGEILVTIRPPATEAHYHNPEAEKLFFAVVEMLVNYPELRMVILPRNEVEQKDTILRTWPEWCRVRKIIIPEHVVDGLNLIWHSDFVVSGGGTMNREAAALGVPVYSIFRGKIGAVDRYLSQEGRLTLVERVEEVKQKIRVEKRERKKAEDFGGRAALKQIVAAVEEVLQTR